MALPSQADIVIHGCDIVTMNDAGDVIRDGVIVISDGRLVHVGPRADIGDIAATTVIDGRDRIAMPGMIDAHVHTAQQLLRGKLAEMSRLGPLRNPPWKNYYVPFEALLDPEDIYLSGLLAYANMIMCGTTCFAEAGGPHPDEMARAAVETGIRGFVALTTSDLNTSFAGRDMPPSMMMTTDEALARNIALVERWRDHPRVRAWMSLRQIIVCSPTLIAGMADAARAHGVKIHTHLAEGTYEVDYALEQHGKRPTEYLNDLGALGPHLHCAHSVILSAEEVDLYATHRMSACHCAFGNYGIGVPRLQEMWRRGVDIGMGTDGAASSFTLDLFQVAHAARVGQAAAIGHAYHQRVPMSGEELLKIATRGGARAVGMGDELGCLEAGRRADLILVDTSDLDHMGSMDPLFLAAHCVVGRDVRDVIIEGAVVMRDRRLLNIDIEALRARVNERRARIMERFDAMVQS
ncbi:amidohydrolase [Komagataeibacter oboediens]|uniref:amidohydrolase family protein n=1 Tax=Komagataeibacter oboediens TaxID=65958 RepID=UPI0023DCE94E|nr:amidohydrolase [Komagataeibacter oboediens]WEQ51699.1 amidohydrolase [Komagataeibacter oboediens]